MRLVRRGAARAAAALFLLAAAPALAQEEAQTEPDDGITVTEGPIATNGDDLTPDEEIAARLGDVFGALSSLTAVEVTVRDGVVTLSGTVPDGAAVERAEILAAKTNGVVAVENRLQQDVSVEGRLTPALERYSEFQRNAIALLPLLAIAAVIVTVAWLLGVLIGRQKWLWRRMAKNTLLVDLIATVIPIVFVLLGLVSALNVLDAVAILSAVLGAAGVLGLAVGFAIRDTIENFIASIMLSLRQPFRAKDFVEIDGQQGAVVRLTSRATILMTPDGNHLRIPNAQVFKAVILNYTRNPERRFTFALGIDAEDDPKAGIETGLDALRTLPFVLAEPAPQAWIEEVGDSNIVLTFAPWIDQRETDFLKAKSAAIRGVKIALEEAGFTLPEPIYRLRVDQVPEGLTQGGAATVRRQDAPKGRLAAAAAEDTSPDPTLEQKVEEDRSDARGGDLLSEHAPTEYDA
ncbi:mechanosensitive ion channel family protein [Parvularcula oceani]|uniref:mechanosensitive ion channel family protein n=1 Tax=Parvularcula oceani TaxID=1247963 RepID=UPI000569CC05|nr:mechanosensitive ion channel family protein [Parvularcula oceani]